MNPVAIATLVNLLLDALGTILDSVEQARDEEMSAEDRAAMHTRTAFMIERAQRLLAVTPKPT